ncbi:uncharacterized protein B0I36DRAFT_73650 [Microdochium trichocladiopsis]|uniref:Uncharacterized protein n=1 Tax=Microdochium trichocladiopsis TaxID=1682393 RepID=A0A9P9BYE8_9PEZI|nr:uncharacterized protein B0I36DRAFT_73650 [Microdochium trichocladiopsis]KAH7037993.1 hypothetical protein B0I36DRAFT_73650 [Microdochium trichocladiopsis]
MIHVPPDNASAGPRSLPAPTRTATRSKDEWDIPALTNFASGRPPRAESSVWLSSPQEEGAPRRGGMPPSDEFNDHQHCTLLIADDSVCAASSLNQRRPRRPSIAPGGFAVVPRVGTLLASFSFLGVIVPADLVLSCSVLLLFAPICLLTSTFLKGCETSDCPSTN